MFKGSTRKSCWIRLLYTNLSLDRWEWSPDRLTRFLETLKEFESVYCISTSTSGAYITPRIDGLSATVTFSLKEGSKVQKTLGPMIFHDNTDPKGLYLEFHPRR